MFGDRAQIAKLKEALDDTNRKLDELRSEYNSLRIVLESMIEGVIAVSKDTRIVSINSSVEKIFGIMKKDAEGRFFLEAIRNNDISEIINNVLLSKEFVSCELNLVWPIQGIFQVNASPILENKETFMPRLRRGANPAVDGTGEDENPPFIPLLQRGRQTSTRFACEARRANSGEGRGGIKKGFSGEISGCLIVIHDITEIRKLEKMRSDFVANVSHELKTPLTSIKGFVETLLEEALEDKENIRRFLQIIQDNANRLDTLVNDLLDLSYLESKEIALEKKEADIRELTEDILAGFKSQLKKKNIAVKNDLPADLIIKADKDKIRQVLINLIDNAIKFNREDGTIKIYNEDSGEKIKFFIEDSGIGIPPKDIPRIFERFYRVDKARSRQLGGTGLGLAIVKHIVELHAGTVGVESAEGLGSKFWFTLSK